MRYEFHILDEDNGESCIRDNEAIVSNGNGGDCVCLGPASHGWPLSHKNWPENARRIVALLNAFDGWSIEQLESWIDIMTKHGNRAMEIPGERVEFSDDAPQFAPVQVSLIVDATITPSVKVNNQELLCAGCDGICCPDEKGNCKWRI